MEPHWVCIEEVHYRPILAQFKQNEHLSMNGVYPVSCTIIWGSLHPGRMYQMHGNFHGHLMDSPRPMDLTQRQDGTGKELKGEFTVGNVMSPRVQKDTKNRGSDGRTWRPWTRQRELFWRHCLFFRPTAAFSHPKSAGEHYVLVTAEPAVPGVWIPQRQEFYFIQGYSFDAFCKFDSRR